MDLVPASVLRALPDDMMYGCACRDLEALMRWFTPRERRVLAQCGFHPVRLRVDVVLAESAWQVVVGRRRPFREGATRLRWIR